MTGHVTNWFLSKVEQEAHKDKGWMLLTRDGNIWRYFNEKFKMMFSKVNKNEKQKPNDMMAIKYLWHIWGKLGYEKNELYRRAGCRAGYCQLAEQIQMCIQVKGENIVSG